MNLCNATTAHSLEVVAFVLVEATTNKNFNNEKDESRKSFCSEVPLPLSTHLFLNLKLLGVIHSIDFSSCCIIFLQKEVIQRLKVEKIWGFNQHFQT